MVRKALDTLYLGSGWLAALCLLSIALVILAQIVGRLIGIVVPSAAQMAGFFLAATIFLGLAYTLAAGEHIRVVLVLDRLGPRPRFAMELFVVLISALVTAYLGVFVFQLAYESWVFDDRADGLLPIPLVLPQAAVAAGVLVLLIRLLDEAVVLIRTGKPLHVRSAEEAALRDMLERDQDGAAGT